MKTIANILKNNDSKLAKLINKVAFSKDLERIFRTTLDSSITKHCYFANYKNSELTVTVSSASVATRLRFTIPDIVKQLQVQPEFKDLTNIRYTIAISKDVSAKSKKAKNKLSDSNKILWQKTLLELKNNKKADNAFRQQH
jgi:hypothetical protein